jgi:hypothetical protein
MSQSDIKLQKYTPSKYYLQRANVQCTIQSRVARWCLCFQTKNRNLCNFLEGLAMEDVGIFYEHFENFTAIW